MNILASLLITSCTRVVNADDSQYWSITIFPTSSNCRSSNWTQISASSDIGSGSICIAEGIYSYNITYDSSSEGGSVSVYSDLTCSGTALDTKTYSESDIYNGCTEVTVDDTYTFSVWTSAAAGVYYTSSGVALLAMF
eukprot:Pgem_evm1s9472